LGGPHYIGDDLPMIGGDHVIGESQHHKSPMPQPCIPAFVTLIIMEGPIRLHNQPGFVAKEVRHIRPDRRLPAKLQSTHTTAA